VYECSESEARATVERLRLKQLLNVNAKLSLHTEAQSTLYATITALGDWKQDRRTSTTRKTGTGIQNILSSISTILENFSGISAIVRAANEQYGGMAMGTLQLLAKVAANKQKREEDIEEALTELSYAFPRLSTLQRLRPTDTLRRLIVQVFELTIVFCRETIEYYLHRSRRLKDAINPKLLKLKTLSDLRIRLSEIHRECEISLLEDLAEIKAKLHRIELTGKDTNDKVRESQKWMSKSEIFAREDYLLKLKKQLGLKRSADNDRDIIETYKSRIKNAFADERVKRKQPRPISWDTLREEPKFSAWTTRTDSAMLLVGGTNFPAGIELNWLSDASIMVVESFSTPLFVLCQTDYTLTRRQRRHFSNVFHDLIYQLARQHPDLLRHQRELIDDVIEHLCWTNKDSSITFDAMVDLLVTLFRSFSNETVLTIVIDRFERCCWNLDPKVDSKALQEAVGALLEVIRHPSLRHVCIKILLVMDNNAACKVAEVMRWRKGAFDCKLDWVQEAEED
jgi:hypothetical protein